MGLLVVVFFGLLIWMAFSTAKSSRNSKLPEEIKMQRYVAKAEAKANTGGAIMFFVAIGVAIYVIAMACGADLIKPPSAQTASATTQSGQ